MSFISVFVLFLSIVSNRVKSFQKINLYGYKARIPSSLLASGGESRIPTTSQLWNWKGYEIRYTKAGSENGTPIILIHGFGASLDYYRKQIPVFADAGFSVYGIDLLGFGGSQKAIRPLEGYSAKLWAQQVLDFHAEVIATRGGKCPAPGPILVGNSIGSRVALEAALVAPDLVR